MYPKRFVAVLTAACMFALALTGSAAAVPVPGAFDPSFGQGGIANGDGFVSEGWATMAVSPEDEIFVLAPNVTNCPPRALCQTATLKLARYQADGSRDPKFAADAHLDVHQHQYQHSALAVGRDGKPVLAALDESHVVVARFGRDGLLDPSFGTAGIANGLLQEAGGTAPVVAVQPDGKVLVAYEASGASPEGRLVLARYLADGNLDPAFGLAGIQTVTALLAHPAGLTLREGGGFDVGLSRCCQGEGGTDLNVGVDRFRADGGLDSSLSVGGQAAILRPTGSYLEAIAAAPEGKVYLVANEEARGSVAVRLRADGTPDPSFGQGGEVALGPAVGASTNVSQIAVDDAGRLVGITGYYGGGSDIFRLLPNGSPDRTFGAGWEVRVVEPGLHVSSPGFGFQKSGRIVMLLESAGSGGGRIYRMAGLFGGTSEVRCLGEKATIVRTNAKEKIVGTPRRDVIAALGGADTVRGLAGNDLICGGKGRDILIGGPGKDRVRQ